MVQATEAEQMQKAAAEMLAHHQQLAALERDRHTAMLRSMQVAQSLLFSHDHSSQQRLRCLLLYL